MKIKKGNLNFDQTGRAYPDNPHIEENWDCIWENEGKHYKLVGDTNDKEWSEVTQLDILTSHMVPEEYLGREEDPRNEVFGYKTSIVGQMLDSDGGFGQVEQSIDENALESERKTKIISSNNTTKKFLIMKTKVYSAFPGVGKTTYFNTTSKNVLDSDSSKFDKEHFPDNYIEHIERNIEDPDVDKILVSSHKDVRDALVKRNIPFVLVYPHRELKDEYIQRYKDRGNNDAFVNLLEKNWDIWMDEMDAMSPQEGQSLYKVKLGPGQYLTDVID